MRVIFEKETRSHWVGYLAQVWVSDWRGRCGAETSYSCMVSGVQKCWSLVKRSPCKQEDSQKASIGQASQCTPKHALNASWQELLDGTLISRNSSQQYDDTDDDRKQVEACVEKENATRAEMGEKEDPRQPESVVGCRERP